MKFNVFLPLGLVVLLAGCAVPPGGPLAAPKPPAPPPLSPAALAALPPNITPDFVIQGSNKCYFIAVEKTEPQVGTPLLNADGTQVCDA